MTDAPTSKRSRPSPSTRIRLQETAFAALGRFLSCPLNGDAKTASAFSGAASTDDLLVEMHWGVPSIFGDNGADVSKLLFLVLNKLQMTFLLEIGVESGPGNGGAGAGAGTSGSGSGGSGGGADDGDVDDCNRLIHVRELKRWCLSLQVDRNVSEAIELTVDDVIVGRTSTFHQETIMGTLSTVHPSLGTCTPRDELAKLIPTSKPCVAFTMLTLDPTTKDFDSVSLRAYVLPRNKMVVVRLFMENSTRKFERWSALSGLNVPSSLGKGGDTTFETAMATTFTKLTPAMEREVAEARKATSTPFRSGGEGVSAVYVEAEFASKALINAQVVMGSSEGGGAGGGVSFHFKSQPQQQQRLAVMYLSAADAEVEELQFHTQSGASSQKRLAVIVPPKVTATL